MGDSVDLRARLVDVGKGAAITAAQIAVNKNPTITGLLGSGTRSTVYGGRSSAPQKGSTTVQEVNAGGLNFKLIDWQKKGEGIIFDLIITSEQDSNLRLFTERGGIRTRIFDDFGNEYLASGIQLGNMTLQYGEVINRIVTGVPMKAIISFDNFLPQTKIITLLEISCLANNKIFSVQLRNIPISK